jgi:phosphoglycolate phosphatase
MTTRVVIFDMDGTLVQSRAAAWEVFRDTIATFDLEISGSEAFFDLFRENFFVGLRAFVGDPAQADAVAEAFLKALRERYTPELIPGMADVVHALAGHYSLAVISSNAMGAIRRTLEHAGVASCFAHVFSGDVQADKTGGIARILADPSYGTIRRCSPSYVEETGGEHTRPAGDQIVLITDTVGDVREGVGSGIRVFGVAWGMHTEADLRAAGAELVALWPQELVAHLLPDGSCTPGGCRCLSCVAPMEPAPVAAVPVACPARDARAAAAAAGAGRRVRRVQAAAPRSSTPGCNCDGPSCTSTKGRTTDPYLTLALAMIAAIPP